MRIRKLMVMTDQDMNLAYSSHPLKTMASIKRARRKAVTPAKMRARFLSPVHFMNKAAREIGQKIIKSTIS
jgi:hypothetical protein